MMYNYQELFVPALFSFVFVMAYSVMLSVPRFVLQHMVRAAETSNGLGCTCKKSPDRTPINPVFDALRRLCSPQVCIIFRRKKVCSDTLARSLNHTIPIPRFGYVKVVNCEKVKTTRLK
jgi:hypothetical protein